MSSKYVNSAVFRAVDKFSGPVDKMASNSTAAMDRMERKFRKVGNAAFSIGRKSGMVGIAIAAPLILATKAAVDFEDKMADVAKVANVAIGSDTFSKLSKDAKTLGVFLGIDAKEAAGLMQNLAQGGVAMDDLDRVSRIAGKMGVAFGMAGDLAGEAFVKTRNALGGTIEETEAVMDTINMLGNTTAAASDQIVTFMASGGSAVARAANASGQELAAYGSTFISMGKSAEESATIMQRFIKQSLTSKTLRPVFDEAGGGAAGMMAIIEKGSKLSGKAQDEYFQQFGAYGLSIQLLAKDMDGLKSSVAAATNEQMVAGSMQKEFENRTNTTAFKLAQMKSRLMSVAISLGTALIPVISDLVESVTPMIERFSEWTSRNKSLVGTIAKVAVGAAGLAFAVSGVSFVIGGVSKLFYVAKFAMVAYSTAVKGVALATQAMGVASSVALGPLTLIIAAASAVAVGAWAVSKAMQVQSREQRLNNEVTSRALENSIDQRVEATMLFTALKRQTAGSEEYKNTLSKIESIQPGITKQYNLQAGALDNINRAEKALIANIMERARTEARAELMKEKITEAMRSREEGPGLKEKAFALASKYVPGFKGKVGLKSSLTADQFNEMKAQGLEADAESLANQQAESMKPLNVEKTKQQSMNSSIEKTVNNKVQLEITGMPDWMKATQTGGGGSGFAMPSTGTTN